MGAIRDDKSYEKSECVLCMDCVYDCSEGETSFAFFGRKDKQEKDPEGSPGMSRKQFLLVIVSGIMALGFRPLARPGRKRRFIRP